MPDHTIAPDQIDQVTTDVLHQIAPLIQGLITFATAAPRALVDLEPQVMRLCKDLGTILLTTVAQLQDTAVPAPTLPCACGQIARYQRRRPATVKTTLGPITIRRPYYTCAACHHGTVPLDATLGLCAGGLSAALDELLALLGATQDSFAAAAAVLERLTLVTVAPNTVRAATEDLGAALHLHDQAVATTAEQTVSTPPLRQAVPEQLVVSLDGVLVHLHGAGWKEVKLGAVYTTALTRSRRTDQEYLRAVDQSFVVDLGDAAHFGAALWREAAERGAATAAEVVVIGDGAHWIWNLADTYFPGATQIVDWYHAVGYLWKAANALAGEGTTAARDWVTTQQAHLWAGEIATVITTLEAAAATGPAVAETLTYYTNHQARMQYATYRTRGYQIGSGTIESGCKHVIGARLKQAGMIWNRSGAEAVATVRTWLKSGRWTEAMAVRVPRRRTYQRRTATPAAPPAPDCAPVRPDLSSRVAFAIAQVQAERRQQPARHPWKAAWSHQRQCEEADQRAGAARQASS